MNKPVYFDKQDMGTQSWPWPSFTKGEMACRHCGELYLWPEFMNRLQNARNVLDKPFRIYSAHRCSLHNARVGGAPLSQHLTLAVDIGLGGLSPRTLHLACKNAGFRGFGFYTTFLHVDMGPRRSWYGGRKARTLWQTY